MITKVKKFLIFGVKGDLDLFYKRAQAEGFLEFIKQGKKPTPISDELRPLVDGIKFLKTIPVDKKIEESMDIDTALRSTEKVLHLKEELIRAEEEKRVTRAEIDRIAPFGDFLMDDLEYIEKVGKRSIQFFCAKSGKGDLLLDDDSLIYVNSAYELDYFVSIQNKPKAYPFLIEMQIENSIKELQNRQTFLQESIRLMEKELKEFACKMDSFQDVLIEGLNSYHLATAKEEAYTPLEESSFFYTEVWAPISKLDRIKPLLKGLSIGFEEIKVEETDKVPTAMENEGFKRIGEDLVGIYDVPATTDKDPSGWVFWFFAVFFAMIIADAGYGLLYLGFAAYLKWKFKTFKGMMKRGYRLLVVLAAFSVLWGVMTVSFFGLNIDQNSPLRKIAPIQWVAEAKAEYHLKQKDEVYEDWARRFPAVASANTGKEFANATVPQPPKKPVSESIAEFSNNILLEFSLVVGIIHIAISLLRYLRRDFAAVGWVLFLVGGYLFFPSMLRATSMINFLGILGKETATAVGHHILFAGLGLVIILGVIQKGLGGLKELMRLPEVFGDVLSYVRLYALSLAGAIMASTFNDMGEAVGIIGGFFVILAGHATNMGLGIVSGIVHGLRLNFIEWYHYSFDGEGTAFNPLKLLKSKED
jgi:V/A-type H+/Na+-transporting ATPase subunit I